MSTKSVGMSKEHEAGISVSLYFSLMSNSRGRPVFSSAVTSKMTNPFPSPSHIEVVSVILKVISLSTSENNKTFIKKIFFIF